MVEICIDGGRLEEPYPFNSKRNISELEKALASAYSNARFKGRALEEYAKEHSEGKEFCGENGEDWTWQDLRGEEEKAIARGISQYLKRRPYLTKDEIYRAVKNQPEGKYVFSRKECYVHKALDKRIKEEDLAQMVIKAFNINQDLFAYMFNDEHYVYFKNKNNALRAIKKRAVQKSTNKQE